MANFLKNQLFRLKSGLFQHHNRLFNGGKKIASHRHIKKPMTDLPPEDVKPNKRKRRPFPLLEQALPLAPKLGKRPKQKFDYFLVLDFEATCESPGNLDPQEIIEFPVLKVNSDTFEIESTFHSYVRPEIHPVLTSFCTELTGVIQSMVDNEPVFKEVFENFQQWLITENILKPDIKFAFATCGDPDLDFLLPLQCYISGIEMPEYMKQWINVKRSFCEITPYTWPDNLMAMMKMCELEFTGDLHSGIDDAQNIARVMADLTDRGLVFDINGWLRRRKRWAKEIDNE